MNRDSIATPIVSPWMDDDLAIFREAASRFVEGEMLPQDEKWRKQHHVDRDIWLKTGEQGLLLTDIPAEYGGGGGDFRHEVIFYEEQSRRGLSGFGQGVHSICAHYVLNHGTEEQKQSYLPRLAKGELIGAIAMTEPSTGSDLQRIRTSARRDGDHFIINGSKTFISNGGSADLLMLAAKTDTSLGAKGVSNLMIETKGLAGYSVGRVLEKMGLDAQDTAELSFDNVRVPVSALLGGAEGRGFYQMMSDLPYERLTIAVAAVAAMEGAVIETTRYVKERQAFGKAIYEFQNTKFKLAECVTIARVARVFLDRCIQQYLEGTLDNETASMAKWWITDMQQKVLDECVQLFGGYGYMSEYVVCRMFADSRVQRIYGGTNEIMKEVIARAL